MICIYAKNMDGVWFAAACDEQRIYGTSFGPTQEDTLRSLLCGLPFNVPFQTVATPSSFMKNLLATLKHVYDGKDITSTFSFYTDHLSDFYRRVLETTLSIPVGYVTSYGAIAEVAGGGPRAVGHVMATNPFAPLVPCHRVVTSVLTLGGYGGGLNVKVNFLAREKRGYKSEKEIPLKNRTLRVFPVEMVFKKLKLERSNTPFQVEP